MKRLANITGRPMDELKQIHCWECDRTAKQLGQRHEFLQACNYVECRVLMCSDCRADHEAMHALAGDDRWDEYLKRKTKELWTGRFK